MKPQKRIVTTVAGALSIMAMRTAAHAQVPFEDLPKVMLASMPRHQQVSIALSTGPEGVANRATVYVLGPKGHEKAREGRNGASLVQAPECARRGSPLMILSKDASSTSPFQMRCLTKTNPRDSCLSSASM